MSAFVEYEFNLGITSDNIHHIIEPSCYPSNITQQLWLKRGFIWYYSFNHEEAINCFNEALQINNLCPIACYGISISHGPNYNTKYMTKDDFPSAELAYIYCKKANDIIKENKLIYSHLTSIEIDLIEALQCRYNYVDSNTPGEQFNHNIHEYINALEIVYNKYPDNACVGSMYVEALLNTNPWKHWDLTTGLPSEPAVKARNILSRLLQLHPYHPGLNHFNIHLLEMSPYPEEALPSCDVLRYNCVPDAGHLIHMPSHIYILLGMYDDAAQCNIEAIRADEKYHIKAGNMNYYTGYRIHNIHFVSYAAMFSGNYQVAFDYARLIHENITSTVLLSPVLAKYFESFLSIDIHVLVRFGKWNKILHYPIPADSELYPFTLSTLYYARGIAYAVLGDTMKARHEQLLFQDVMRTVPPDRVRHNNLCSDLNQIADAMLEGEILYREGDYQSAFKYLKIANEISENLVYDEPWGWMQPPCHALGGLLLEQGRVDEAEYYFRRDMDRSFYGRCHPENIWALCGLAGCLKYKLTHQNHYSHTQTQTHSHTQTHNSGKYDYEQIKQEYEEVLAKIETIRMKSGDNSVHVNVSCMCVQRSEIE